jgi:hypothetical protein
MNQVVVGFPDTVCIKKLFCVVDIHDEPYGGYWGTKKDAQAIADMNNLKSGYPGIPKHKYDIMGYEEWLTYYGYMNRC